jgi:hypothetical protein
MHISDSYALRHLLTRLADGRVNEVFQMQETIKALLEAVSEDIDTFEKEYDRKERLSKNELFVSSINGVFNKKDFRE